MESTQPDILNETQGKDHGAAMTSRHVEDLHVEKLAELFKQANLECVRERSLSVIQLESRTTVGEEMVLEEASPKLDYEQIEEEFRAEEIDLEEESQAPYIFPTPSLRRTITDQIREIEKFNAIHVLPERFNKDLDPADIPKIEQCTPQVYIDALAKLVGCTNYKSCLAEYWFLDTMANLLRRAQADELDRQAQAVLILWFCEWMKEMQNFDAANRERMMMRFEENMMSAAIFISTEAYVPTPAECNVYYEAPENGFTPLHSSLDHSKQHLPATTSRVSGLSRATRTSIKSLKSASKMGASKMQVTFERPYACSLLDLTLIIHYIFDLFSTDFQYDLVRSVFTFPPDYISEEAQYQMHMPKRLYAPLKVAKKKSPRSEKSARKPKGKGPAVPVAEPPTEYIELMKLKAKEEAEIEEREAAEKELWNRQSHILPLNFAITEDFLEQYWPPPPPPPPPPEPLASAKDKGKKKKK